MDTRYSRLFYDRGKYNWVNILALAAVALLVYQHFVPTPHTQSAVAQCYPAGTLVPVYVELCCSGQGTLDPIMTQLNGFNIFVCNTPQSCIINSDCSSSLKCVDGTCSRSSCVDICQGYGYSTGVCTYECSSVSGDWLGYTVQSPYTIAGGEIGVCPGEETVCCCKSTSTTTTSTTGTTQTTGTTGTTQTTTSTTTSTTGTIPPTTIPQCSMGYKRSTDGKACELDTVLISMAVLGLIVVLYIFQGNHQGTALYPVQETISNTIPAVPKPPRHKKRR
jgi:hypothetical protein